MVQETWYFQNVSLVILNNFNHYLHLGQTISKCLKQQSSDAITENQQNDVCKWHHMSDMGHGIKWYFFQNVSLWSYPRNCRGDILNCRKDPYTIFLWLPRIIGQSNKIPFFEFLNHVDFVNNYFCATTGGKMPIFHIWWPIEAMQNTKRRL